MMNGRVYSFLLFLVASAILENIQESHAQHHHVRRPRAYQNDQDAIEQKIDPMMEWTGAHGQVQQKKYFNRTSFQFVRTERKLKRSGKGKGVKKKDATLFPLKSSSSKSSKSFIKEDAAFNQIEDNVNYDIPTIKSLKTPAIKEETETAVATVPWRDLAESGTVVSLDPVDREDRAFYDIGVASYDTPPATVKKNAAFYEIGVASYVAATDEEDAAFYQIGVASYVAPPTTKANNVPKIKASKAPVIKSTKKRNLEESETAAAIIPWRDLTKSGPGVYLFQSMHTLHQEFGVSVSVGGASQNTVIEEEFNIQLEYKGKNPKRIDLLRCQNCMPYDGIWYCGLSENGAAFGLVRQDSTVKFGATKATGTHSQLDILIPVSNDDKKLLLFAERLKPTLKKFRSTPQGVGVDIRVLVTRYYIHNQDLESEEHKLIRQKVAQNADIEEGFVEFVFVSDNNKHFQRAQSINALHKKACHEEDCVVVVVDVDMDVSHLFLINALSFVESGKSAYFPVVWSEYNPETTSLAEEYHGSELPRFSKDKGTWRSYGFGMYAMAGKDTKIYSLDETFMGWGGEDKAFFDLVVKQLNVIRMNEPGLVHVWHPKTCEVGNFVEPAFYHNW